MADHSAPHEHDPDHTPFLESELTRTGSGSGQPARRRRLPGWLVPAVAALVVGVLIGVFLSRGGSDAGATTAVAPTTSAAAPTITPPLAPMTRSEPVQVDIPAIDVSSQLVDLGLNGDGTLEVPTDFSRAGWFTGGNQPGDPSGPPALIAGHVDDYTGPAVFYRLRDLVVGDEVLVVRADNTVAVFTVTSSDEYPKTAFPAEQVYAPVADSELVLITCTGSFDETARSYLDNLVVRATLDEVRSQQETAARAASGASAPAADQPNV